MGISHNFSSTSKTESLASGTTNENVCNIQCLTVSQWCYKCHIWICDKCLNSHSTVNGCSTANLKSKKEEHLKNKSWIIANFEEGANYLSNELQEHEKKAEKHTRLAEKRVKGKKIRILSEEANGHKKTFE